MNSHITSSVIKFACNLPVKVLLVPGGAFMINSSDPCPYVRAAFSLSTPEQIDEVQTRKHR